MSCYFRHLKEILSAAGLEVTTSNRKEIDRVLHQIVGVIYKDCPATWKQLKQDFNDAEKRQKLIRELKKALG